MSFENQYRTQDYIIDINYIFPNITILLIKCPKWMSGMNQNKIKQLAVSLRAKKSLCAIFAGVAILGGCGVEPYSEPYHPKSFAPVVTVAGQQPPALVAFNDKAIKMPRYEDPSGLRWTRLLRHQAECMEKPQCAQPYRKYLKQFKKFGGEPLAKAVNDVSDLVQYQIGYSDTLYGKDDDYWATPAETVRHGEGDCKDQAVLQYFILRSLGVPSNRMFIAYVNADRTNGNDNETDHAVLLVNVAPVGKLQDFLVMNDTLGVFPDSMYEKDWRQHRYTFFDARNENGFWATKRDRVYGLSW